MIIKENFNLAPFNTFGVEAVAHELSIVTSVDVLDELFAMGKLNEKVLVLSKGSNILFTDNYPGLVLLNQMWGKEIIKEDKSNIFLKVNAGEFWPSLVNYTVENGWGGIENMTDIPGKIGAAPIQNIGAYGVEFKDVFVSLEAYNFSTGISETFTKSDCNFGYRNSIFKSKLKNSYFITYVVLELQKNPKVNLSYKPLAESFKNKNIEDVSIADVSKKVAEIRNMKLPNPDIINNAGSFFKNPIIEMSTFHDMKLKHDNVPNYPQINNTYKISAAWLIEQCGWKGKRVGNVGVHENQALVIVKYDDASGSDILNLAKSVQKSVKDKFDIHLEFEVNII